MKQAPAPDHKAVAMVIKTGSNTRGKGSWKINNSVLKEENYKVGINKLFVDLLEEYGQDVPKPLLLLTIYDSQPFVETELLLHVQPTTHKQNVP